MFPAYLRDAGYYCSNNAKEDYNLVKPADTWDESSKQAHWRKRGAGQPFFSVFNHEITHESQVRARPHTLVHDPAKVRVPAYHPDTPEVRHDWAQYYDNITTMDGQAGRLLADLKQDGLADDTIVFFYGDHGAGMPRSKRWPYNSGLNVSIVVSIPEKFKHLAPKDYVKGGKNGRLVGFVDLAPTMLSLAGIPIPEHLQGQAFLGPKEGARRTHSYGFRGRMDERYDCVRTVRDEHFVYVRNYMPHKIYGQYLAYMWQTPTTQVWERLYKEGKLKPPQTYFWEKKPAEELFDLRNDRDEVRNLASSPAHQDVLRRFRQVNQTHLKRIRDIGLLPENEIHTRDHKQIPVERVLAAAELASSLKPEAVPQLEMALQDSDSAVRYWAAMGWLMREKPAPLKALEDPAPAVRIAAAESIGRYGRPEDLAPAMKALLSLANAVEHGAYVAMLALNALDALGTKVKPWRDAIVALPDQDANAPERVRTEYLKRLLERLRVTLG
jgi:uncharacterized sulfatase